MNNFDIGIIVVITLSAIIGLMRGLTKESLSLVSWASAISLAYMGYPLCQQFARQHIANHLLADITTALVLFIIILITITFLSNFLSSWIKQSSLGGIDRALGFLFGIARGILLLFVTGIIINCIWPMPNQPKIITEARFGGLMHKGSTKLFNALPIKAQEFISTLQKKHLFDVDQSNLSITKTVDLLNNPQSAQAVGQSSSDEADLTADDLSTLNTKTLQMPTQTSKQSLHKQDASLDRLLDQSDSANETQGTNSNINATNNTTAKVEAEAA